VKIKEFMAYGEGEDYKACIQFRLPEVCPVCNRGIAPIFRLGCHDSQKEIASATFQCPICAKFFFSVFSAHYNNGYKIDATECVVYTFPDNTAPKEFSRHIHAISTQFIEIYNQSLSAESRNLSEICGIGYRKALEFLVKDYLISKIAVDDDAAIQAIRQKFLGRCIKEDITNENIKICAERATWLGNDETHYERRFENKDVTDLKRLVDLCVKWIEMELETQEALGLTPT